MVRQVSREQGYYNKMIAAAKSNQGKQLKPALDNLKSYAQKAIRDLIADATQANGQMQRPHDRLNKVKDIFVKGAGSLRSNPIPNAVKVALLDYLNGKYPATASGDSDDWKKYMAGKDGTQPGSEIDVRGKTKATAAAEAKQPVDKMHAHHIVMRNGPAYSQQARDDVAASKAILKRTLGINDTDTAWQNLVWAPNFSGGNHTPDYAKAVRYYLEQAEAKGFDILETLRDLGKRFNKGDTFPNGR